MSILKEIRAYFLPQYSTMFANPKLDVLMLSCMAYDVLYKNARNGKRYYYFFLDKKENLRLAAYLMRRNNIPAEIYTTMYHYRPEKVLRVSQKIIEKKSDVKNFLDGITARCSEDSVFDYESQVQLLKRQIKGYER